MTNYVVKHPQEEKYLDGFSESDMRYPRWHPDVHSVDPYIRREAAMRAAQATGGTVLEVVAP